MVKFLTVDIFVILSAVTGSAYYLSQIKRKRREEAMIDANFVGGPLDGQKRSILCRDVFIYKHKDLDKSALYRHTGYNIYEFSGNIDEEGGHI